MAWIFFVVKKFFSKEGSREGSLGAWFSIMGLTFGALVLVVTLSVMNGFQHGYINTILEISSGHVILKGNKQDILAAQKNTQYESFVIFSEAQTLVKGSFSRRNFCMLQAVPENILALDKGLNKTLSIIEGDFDIEQANTAVIGNQLAYMLGVNVGDTLPILAASGSSDVDMFPKDANLLITGIFKSDFYEVDSSLCYISEQTGKHLFGELETTSARVKLNRREQAPVYLSQLKHDFPEIEAESWQTYNQAFFNALAIEKNLMLVLVALIFIVVAVNIFNSMRRSIHEHREDIAVLSALGAKKISIQSIFILHGFFIGLLGATLGIVFGLLISVNINTIFSGIEAIINFVNALIAYIFSAYPSETFQVFNQKYFYLESVPVDIVFSEIWYIFLFALLSSSYAAYSAAKKITAFRPAEVLRYE